MAAKITRSALRSRAGGRMASVFREQALRSDRKDDQEHDMPRQHLPRDVELRADRLCDAEHDAARERAPETPESAEDDRLERDQKTRAARRRVKIGPHRHETGGDGDGD